jgi:hypothetical protein
VQKYFIKTWYGGVDWRNAEGRTKTRSKVEEEVRTGSVDEAGIARERGCRERVFMPCGPRLWAYVVVRGRDEWGGILFRPCRGSGSICRSGVYNAEGTCYGFRKAQGYRCTSVLSATSLYCTMRCFALEGLEKVRSKVPVVKFAATLKAALRLQLLTRAF